MLRRSLLIAAFALFGLAAGADLLSPPAAAGAWAATLEAAQSREATKQAPRPPRPEEFADNMIGSFRNLIGANHELFIYGAMAAFGILMMGLAIGNASSSKNKNHAQIETLRQEKAKAENLAKLKSEFLNQVSHELRTPLAVIIGYIECITDGLYGQIEPKHLEILQVVAKQSTHLKNMIDQILIYSRLEAGKQPIRVDDLNLSKILQDLKDTFDFLCRQKGLQLGWEIHSDSISVRSDATRLKEVISNLLQNAVKYTDKGSIILRTAKLPGQAISVEVEDTGMGISEAHLASIFEPFMQVHKTSTENSRGGIGLGLSIVRKHLEQIGGTISVTSELGKGSIFRIELPRNFERQKSRAKRFLGWANGIRAVLTRPAAAPRQKTANTSHAIGQV